MKKILIVEDEVIVAEDIASMLENAGYTISGIAESADQALALFKKERPYLVVCDIQIKGLVNGIELIHLLSKIAAVPLIYITAFADQGTIKKASQTYPLAYLVKPFTEKQLVATVDLAIQSFYGNGFNQEEKNIPYPTNRELQILSLLAKGYVSRQIAEELSLSEHTVQTHRKNMMQKYKTGSSAELIGLATKLKWVST